ncbi:hypothetical protein D3C72_2186500 [compost metagenome]
MIAAAHRELRQGDPFEIIEARMSESLEHEGSDFIPFLRSRNHESLTALSTPDALKGDAK